jgi:branched-chain amino acid transport system substrate-binding protein
LPQTIFKGLLPHIDKAGLEIVSKQEFELGAKDYTSQLVSVARERPEGLLLLAYYTDAALALKQSREKGVRNIQIAADPSAINDAVPVIAGGAAEGLRAPWLFPHYLTGSSPEMIEFRNKWTKAFGTPPVGRPNYTDLVGYGDAFVLALALQAAGEDLTWDGLIKAWETIADARPSRFAKYGTDIIFPESFSSTDHTGNQRFSVIEVKDGKWDIRK